MSGWTDLPLNSVGLRQLQRLRRRFFSEPAVSALYSSPLVRARQTAEQIAQAKVLSLRLLPDLREINCGDVDGEPIAAVKQRYPELWEQNLRQDDDDFRWPRGESYREFRERSLRALKWITEQHPVQRVAIVTHAGFITQVLGVIHRLPPARWEPFRPDNTSVTEVRWQNGTGELVSFNDHRHLTAW